MSYTLLYLTTSVLVGTKLAIFDGLGPSNGQNDGHLYVRLFAAIFALDGGRATSR